MDPVGIFWGGGVYESFGEGCNKVLGRGVGEFWGGVYENFGERV